MKQTCRSSIAGCSVITLALSLLWIPGFAPSSVHAADRIILRNLKTITDKTVVAFDVDGIQLDDRQILGWHEIEKAKVSGDKQPAFDAMLAELGGHLYRIRQRLSVGDYEGLLPHAEAIHDRYAGRTSDAAYTVLQALMWGRLAAGHREGALAPYLQCYDILRRRGGSEVELPGERRLVFDPRTGLTTDLVPVWFDPAAAKAEMPAVYQAIRTMSERPEGVYIYYASLALTAGEHETAGKVLGAIRSTEPPIGELREITEAQREVLTSVESKDAVGHLRDHIGQFSNENLPLGLYWLGRDQLNSDDIELKKHGLLTLLRIPATHGDSKPELAGAALLLAMQTLADINDVRGSIALRGELLAKYGNTYAAKQVDRPSSTKLNP